MTSRKEVQDKLNKITVDEPSKWLEENDYRLKNRNWLRVSQNIAFEVLEKLDELNLTKEDLAKQLNLDISEVNLLVKGSLNISLSLLVNLEEVLKINFLTKLAKWKKSKTKKNNKFCMGFYIEI